MKQSSCKKDACVDGVLNHVVERQGQRVSLPGKNRCFLRCPRSDESRPRHASVVHLPAYAEIFNMEWCLGASYSKLSDFFFFA